jgi:putative thioredoxin
MLTLEQLESPHILEGRDANFAEIGFKKSAIGLVLVNYLSPKAGSCLRRYQILDQVTREAAGKFLLVNAHVERPQPAASDHGIAASVPTLSLFRNGQGTDSRHGYHDETGTRQLPSRHVTRPSETASQQALATYCEDAAQGLRLLAETDLEDPGDMPITATLAKLLVQHDGYDEAYRRVDALPEDVRTELSDLYLHLSLIRVGAEAPDRAALQAALEQVPDDDDARFKLAATFVRNKEYASALAELLLLVRRQPPYRKGIALLALFKLLGPEDPLSVKYQAELSRFAH